MKNFSALVLSSLSLIYLTSTIKAEENAPIFKAAQSQNYKEMKKLLKDGADPNQKNQWGETPLFISSEKGYFNLVTLLVNNGANTNIKSGKSDWTPIFAAVDRERPDIVQILLEHGANVNEKDKKGWTPLHLAARRGFEYISSILLMNKADVNAQDNAGWTPLHEAARHGKPVIVKLLMSHHANTGIKDKKGNTPAQVARSEEIKDLILHKKFHKPHNAYKGSDLIEAAKHNNYAKTHNILRSHKVDVNSKDGLGKTALHYAVEKGMSEIVKLLMHHHADKTIKDNSGKSPLDMVPNSVIGNILNQNTNNNKKSPVKMNQLDNVLDSGAGEMHIGGNKNHAQRHPKKHREDIDQKKFHKDFKNIENEFNSMTDKEKKEYNKGFNKAGDTLSE